MENLILFINIVIFFISIVLLFIMAKPQFLANVIGDVYGLIASDYVPPDCVAETFTDPETKYTSRILIRKCQNDTGLFIFDIPGGAFINSQTNRTLFDSMQCPYTTYHFEYPVLFKAAFNETCTYLKNAIFKKLKELVDSGQKFKFVFTGTSAGAYLVLMVYRALYDQSREFKEHLAGIFTVSGYFGAESLKHPSMLKLVDYMYLTSPVMRSRFSLSKVSVPLFILVGQRDFIYESSIYFARKNNVAPHIYKGTHVFFNDVTSPDTQSMYMFMASEMKRIAES